MIRAAKTVLPAPRQSSPAQTSSGYWPPIDVALAPHRGHKTEMMAHAVLLVGWQQQSSIRLHKPRAHHLLDRPCATASPVLSISIGRPLGLASKTKSRPRRDWDVALTRTRSRSSRHRRCTRLRLTRHPSRRSSAQAHRQPYASVAVSNPSGHDVQTRWCAP